MKKNKKKPLPFHSWLGKLMEELLTPVDVTVKQEYEIMAQSPRTDYFLLGHHHTGWSEAQQQRLPDGIRDLQVSQVLIEFKFTESVNEETLVKAAADWMRYRDYAKLSADAVKMVVLSSKITVSELLKTCGYKPSDKSGVYRSEQAAFRFVDLILLNELADTPYNGPYKLFASRPKQRDQAFKQLLRSQIFLGSTRLEILGEVIFESLSSVPTIPENQKMTIEELMSHGTELMDAYWAQMSVKERMKGISKEERLLGISEDERLKGISKEKRLLGISNEERLLGISKEERLSGISKEELKLYLKQLQN